MMAFAERVEANLKPKYPTVVQIVFFKSTPAK